MTRITPQRPASPIVLEVLLADGPYAGAVRTVKADVDGIPPARLTFVQYEVRRSGRPDLAFHTYIRHRAEVLGAHIWQYAYLDPNPPEPEEEPADAV